MTNFDFQKLYEAFSKMCEKLGLTMIEMNGSGNQPPMPFVSFDIISPFIPLNFLEDDQQGIFESVVSLTVHTNRKIDALNLADKLRQSFNLISNKDYLLEKEIVVIEKMPIQIRYVEEANNYSYMVGFDVRLRLVEEPNEDVEDIKDIDI